MAEQALVLTEKRRDIALSLVEAINSKHQEGLECDEALRECVERKLRVTVECGLLIQEARDVFKSRFDDLVGRFLGFSPLALRSYVRIAQRKRPLPDFKSKWVSVREAAEPTSLIPLRDGHGPQRLIPPNFFSASTKVLMNFLAGFRKHAAAHPLDEWSLDSLEQFAAQLKPIVDIYAQVQKRVAASRK